MPMFDDPKKELQRLQQELLAEEEYEEDYLDEEDWLDQEIAEAKALSGYEEPPQPQVRNYANGYGAQAAPQYQRPAQPQQRTYMSGYSAYREERPDYRAHDRAFRDQVIEEEEEEKLGGLVALACLLTAGIVAVAMYWVLVLL